MLKTIYRAALRGEGNTLRFYGFAAEDQMAAFLGEYPNARPCGAVHVTAQQLSEWKCQGEWPDDWQNGKFIPEGRLLRWRLDDDHALSDLGAALDAAHMTVRDICAATNLTQAALAARFGIPKRTVEDWCAGKRSCVPYIRLMMCEILGLI